VARLDPVKDLGSLLKAAAGLREAGIAAVLMIVGDGPERPALEALAGNLGIADAVRFLGQRNDARRWLAGCDAYVNCSVSEGVSLTILEAMAAALPIVATRVGGTPEVIDEASGLLVPARHAPALQQALVSLIGDAGRRRTLGDGARARVETTFTLDRMIRAYATLYEAR